MIQGARGSKRKENTGSNRRQEKKQYRCSTLEFEIVLKDLAKAPICLGHLGAAGMADLLTSQRKLVKTVTLTE